MMDRDAVMSADREWAQSTKDVDRFVAFFAPEGSVNPPGMPVATGAAKIRDTYSQMSSALPAQMHHYALARTATMIQIHGIGPFVLNYVNRADDPSRSQK